MCDYDAKTGEDLVVCLGEQAFLMNDIAVLGDKRLLITPESASKTSWFYM